MTVPSDGSVTESKIGSGAVTSSKLSSGKILNVVNDSDNTNTVISSTTYADTGLSASITPSSTSSKILITVSQDFQLETTSSQTNILGGFKLLRDSTTLYTGSDDGHSFGVRIKGNGSSSREFNFVWSYQYYDTPSSTSSIVYKLQCRTYNTNSRFRLNNQINGTSKSFITLMEIAG
jgi:hypothetical protein